MLAVAHNQTFNYSASKDCGIESQCVRASRDFRLDISLRRCAVVTVICDRNVSADCCTFYIISID